MGAARKMNGLAPSKIVVDAVEGARKT